MNGYDIKIMAQRNGCVYIEINGVRMYLPYTLDEVMELLGREWRH